MPPEFVPSERRKKKQNPKPKEPRSVDDLVDDIMKDYRDKQRELGNVDNWGQPNEKLDRKEVEKWVRKNLPKLKDNEKVVKKRGSRKFSPKAATESLSEAIGNKLKEKADTQKDKQNKSKTPKTSEPRKSKQSPIESRSPKPKFSSKNEPRKQLDPKIKTKPSEARRKKVRFPRAPTEGLSKAIGDKLKEKAEQLKDSQKTPKISNPRKFTHSPKEWKSPEPKSLSKREPRPTAREKKTPQLKTPQNKEHRERLGPKLKMKPPEVQAKKVESLKTPTESLSDAIGKKFKQKQELKSSTEKKRTTEILVKDIKVGKSYEVKLYTPEIRGVKIHSESALKKIVNDELPGMKHLPYFDKIIGDAVAHIQLRKLVGVRTNLTLKEIRSLSDQTQLPLRNTRGYVYKEGKPQFYRLAEKAITKSEAKSIGDRLQPKLGNLKSHSDVITKLKEKSILEELQKLSTYDQNNGMVQKYFRFLEELPEGGLMSDITRRVGVSEGTGIQWTKGVFPSYIKKVLETPDASISRAFSSLKEKPLEFVADILPKSRININPGEIKGVPVVAEKQLRNIITTEYQGMVDMPGFDKMLYEACVHICIMNRLQGRTSLEPGELTGLAREFNVQPGTLGVRIRDGITPRLYLHIDQSISRSDALEKMKTINDKNNGVTTKVEYDRRMSNYYLRYQEQSASFQTREELVAQNYFKFFEQYQLGGSFKYIAQKVGVAPSTGLGWLEGNQPRKIRIASTIPQEQPIPGHKWIPLRVRAGRYPENFIQVPERVQSYVDVVRVLRQLKPLENKYLEELQTRLGRRSIEEEFMYLLGVYISDGSSFNSTTLARSVGIRLSRTYPWSRNFGDGLCQALGACGIYAHRTENTVAKATTIRIGTRVKQINQNEKLNWASENSPLLHWMHRSCLGYSDSIPKNNQTVFADWIMQAPHDLRRAVLQGLGDGDGSASVQGNYICISSKCNKDFIEKLLQSFGLKTRRTDCDVVTAGMAEAKKAAQIPSFRFASTRLEASKRIVNRINGFRRVREYPLNQDEIKFIIDMKGKGMTVWEANEAFFDKFHTAIHKSVVEKLFLKEK